MLKVFLAILFVLSAVAISICGEDDGENEYKWHDHIPQYDYKQSQSIVTFNSRNDRRRYK